MANKNNLQKLSRAELLELLLAQIKEKEQLQEKLEKTEAALAERYLRIRSAGDLAHAVLEVNNVMKSAQDAAQQYLDNMEQMEEETRERCRLIIAEAMREADRIREEARMDAERT